MNDSRAGAPSGRPSAPALLVTADDRTGALESGGACAEAGFDVRLVTAPGEQDCAVIDLDSRHSAPATAAARIAAAHAAPASERCHKMDSGLRGNWAHEVAALLASGRRVGVLASFPDAGRRCDSGTVLIHDVPVAESAFGNDPRSRLTSSRPKDHLLQVGCEAALRRGDVVVLDANDNAQLEAAANRCRAERRMLVGTTGGIAAYVKALRPDAAPPSRLLPLPRPALVVCGSLHPLSRHQIDRLGAGIFRPTEARSALTALQQGRDAVLATSPAAGDLADAAAEATAAAVASAAWEWLRAAAAPTLIVLGGDTARAILGARNLRVLGNVDTGVPLCAPEGGALAIVTKGGGIGAPDTLARLLPSR